VRRSEQAIHLPLVRVVARVREERLQLLGRRRQAEQVEAQPAQQLRARGLGRRRHVLLLETGEDEAIDGVPAPGGADSGQRWSPRRDVRPVRLPRGAFHDPAPQRLDLRARQPRLAARDVRHALVVVRVRDALDQRALLRLAGHDRDGARRERGLRVLLAVEPQPRLAPVAVGAVAAETVVGEDRPHVAVELEPWHQRRRGRIARLRNDGSRRAQHQAFRPVRAFVDPAAERVDLRRGQRVLQPGHPLRRLTGRDALVEQARARVPRHDHRARLAALRDGLRAVEPQFALDVFGAMAAQAHARQDRLHLAHEVDLLGGAGWRTAQRAREERHERRGPGHLNRLDSPPFRPRQAAPPGRHRPKKDATKAKHQ
jgi:hypothetical protein